MRATLLEALTQAPACPCHQLFLSGETSLVCPTLSAEDRAAVRDYCDQHQRTFYSHCPLTAFSNLANTDNVMRSCRVVADELWQIRDLPAACVLHMGKVAATGVTDGGRIGMIAECLNDITVPRGTHPRMPRQLLMECAAGQKNELGATWEDLRHLYETLDNSTIGLCLDTQHLFAAGMCNFATVESVVRLFDAAEEVCPKSLALIHLNDSKKPFGSHVDRHESLRQGYIWSQDDSSLRALIARCREDNIDVVLETPTPAADLATLTSI
jgi:deoxyribonuclease-4